MVSNTQLTEAERGARDNLIQDLHEAIASHWPHAQLSHFGSYACGLSTFKVCVVFSVDRNSGGVDSGNGCIYITVDCSAFESERHCTIFDAKTVERLARLKLFCHNYCHRAT